MAKPKEGYKRLDPELYKEIVELTVATSIRAVRSEEAKIVKARHDHIRGCIKLALRKYREISEHVKRTVYDAIHADDDLTLQELMEMMSGSGREHFRVDSLRESAAKSHMLVKHMDRMIESYRESCELSSKEEDGRRFRIVYSMYISEEPKTADEIALAEHIDKSTVYRDVDAAADRLAVLFFGVFGLKFF